MKNNPFPGIRSFELHEAHLFYGREKQVDKIVSVLADTHFLALIGFSGSGKSSLIKAGVIPAILDGKINQKKDWTITFLKPGDRAFNSFALEYTKTYNKIATSTGKKIIDAEEVEKDLHDSTEPIYDAYKKLTQGTWLIVIDQFEEIFRYRKDRNPESARDESQKFVDLFLDVLNTGIKNIPIYIIFTMQSDFLDQCTELSGLTEAINLGHYIIPRMSPKSLHDAIVKPIKENGNSITKELVERLLSDLGDQADQLPVMQHALMRAWNYWSKNRIGDQPLDISHYEEIGTISSALSIHAEEIYEGLGSDEKKELSERLFKALTDLGDGAQGIRRSARLEDIQKLTSCTESDLIEVIDQFRGPGRAFLMPPYQESLYKDTIIDISHESIMRVWKRLKTWVEEETKSAELYLRLSKSSELYQQGKATLWTNPELEIAVNWKQKNNPNPYWADRYDPGFERAMDFLDYSKSESDFEIRKKENKQKKELKRARGTVVFLSLASIVSVLFLVISLNLRFQAEASEEIALEKGAFAQEESKKAEKQRREAVAQRRIAEQQQEIAEQQKLITEEQKVYAITQHRIASENEKKAKISETRALESEAIAIEKEKEAKISEIKSKEKEAEALVSEQKAIKSEKNTERLRLLAIARSMAVESQRLASANPELAILLAGQAYKFNQENKGNVHDPDIFNSLSIVVDDKPVFRGHTDAVRSVILSYDGNRVFSGSDDGRLLVWDADNKTSPVSLNTNDQIKNGIRSIDVYNGKVVSGSGNGTVLLWKNADRGTIPIVILAHSDIIKSVKFISDKLIVSVSADRYIKVWDMQNISQPVFARQMNEGLTDVSVSGDKTTFACVGESGKIWVYSSTQLKNKPIEINTEKPITAVALNYKGNRLATGGRSGIITIRDIVDQSNNTYVFLDHKSTITALVFSSNDKFLASSSYDNTIRIWNPSISKQNPIVISDHDSWVMDISYNQKGNVLASCSNDKTIILTQVDPEILSSKVCEKVGRNLTITEWENFVGKDIEYQKTCSE